MLNLKISLTRHLSIKAPKDNSEETLKRFLKEKVAQEFLSGVRKTIENNIKDKMVLFVFLIRGDF
jgi:hypothetical protein